MNTPNGTLRRWFRLLLGISVSGAFVLWLTHTVNSKDILAAMAGITPLSIAASLGILVLSIPLRAVQWIWLMEPPNRISFRASVQYICLGHLANLFLPLRGGEVVKAGLLSRKTGLPFESALASVALCRLQDLPPIFIVSGVVAFLLNPGSVSADLAQAGLDIDPGVTRAAIWGMGIAMVALLGGFTAAFLALEQLQALMAWIARPFPEKFRVWILRRSEHVLGSLRVVRRASPFWGAQALSLLCWVIFAVASVPILAAFDLPMPLSIRAAVSIAAFGTFAQVIPAAPSALGVFHAACLGALAVSAPSLSHSDALAIAVIVHLVGNIGPALPGVLVLVFPSVRRSPYASQ